MTATLAAIACGALALAIGCDKKSPAEPTPVGDPVGAFLSSVVGVGATGAGVLQPGAPPSPQAGGPPVTPVGSGTAFPGNANPYVLTSPAPFQQIFISASPVGAGSVPADGFFRIDLAVPSPTAQVIVSFGNNIPASNFQLRFQVSAIGGPVGPIGVVTTAVSTTAPVVSSLTVSGQVTLIPTPPDARGNRDLESNTTTSAFRERSAFVLTAPLPVDFTAPGTYTITNAATAFIAPGTRVDSYYLFIDAVGAIGGIDQHYAGALTFDSQILGIIASEDNQVGTHSVVGAPGTLYSTVVTFDPTDSLSISADRRTVYFTVMSNQGADSLRIIVATPSGPGLSGRFGAR